MGVDGDEVDDVMHDVPVVEDVEIVWDGVGVG